MQIHMNVYNYDDVIVNASFHKNWYVNMYTYLYHFLFCSSLLPFKKMCFCCVFHFLNTNKTKAFISFVLHLFNSFVCNGEEGGRREKFVKESIYNSIYNVHHDLIV